MPEIQRQSSDEDRYLVRLGGNVVICDLPRAEAEALLAAYDRLVQGASGGRRRTTTAAEAVLVLARP